MIQKIQNLLAGLIIFLAPAHFFLKLTEQSAFVNGLRVDYLIPKLFAVDFLILIFIFLAIFVRRKKPAAGGMKQLFKNHPVAMGLLLISLTLVSAGTLFANPISGGWHLIQLAVMAIFAAQLYRLGGELTAIYPAMALSIIFQSAIGIAQFVRQQSLFGYQLLGEPNLTNPIGLAKTTIQGSELILPYGTTPHPNILGGFLAIYLLAVLKNLLSGKKRSLISKLLYFVAVILGGIALILTFSVSAWIMIILGSLLLVKQLRGKLNSWIANRKIILSFFIILTLIFVPILLNLASRVPAGNHPSILRRDYLNRAAVAMFLDKPVVGVGLNSYTRQVERYSSEREVVRFVQPAHHLGLLWLAEAGIAGIVFASSLMFILTKKKLGRLLLVTGLLLLPSLVLDHYLLSLHQGMLLIAVLLAAIMPNWLSQS